MVTEIELPGPPGAPVLGLVVHGDVQPVDPEAWSLPPFAGVERDGEIFGRGAADDKGPLIQALLAMRALQATQLPRTHTVRLLVGSDEESGSQDIRDYLLDHSAPDLSLVLDSAFPVVVGEKAWDGLTVAVPVNEGGSTEERAGAEAFPFAVASLEAGIGPSIVPDRATLVLRWRRGVADWNPIRNRLCAKPAPQGFQTECSIAGDRLTLRAYGHAAHSGVNIEGGRNALVHLARIVEGELPAGGASDLLAFARLAGVDIYGTGLGLTRSDPVWGRYAVNVAQVRRGNPFSQDASSQNQLVLVINLRRIPPMTASDSQQYLERIVADFNQRTGAELLPGGYFQDEPLAFNPESKLVKRLLEDYRQVMGRSERPAISGGGTYAKRLPHSIAFGMWLPGKPYPGHDANEKISLADLHLGTRILLYALADLVCSEPIADPFAP
jgi:predicted dipeptidase